jgi:PAS domain S-box-containing protein
MPKDNPENYKRMIEESIVDTVREPLIVLDADLRVISANKSFYRSFKVNPKETQGRLIYDLGNRQWNIPKLRQLLEEILPKSTTIENYEIEHDFPHIGRRIMLLNARRIPRPPAKPRIMLLAIEDITERKKVEEGTLREEGEKWNSLMKNTDDVIMIVNGQGIIQYINRTIPPYSPEETIGKSVYEYVIKEQRNIMSESLKKVSKTGEPDSYEISSNIPKIGTMWFSTKVVPIKHDKVVKKIIMISTDITERKRTEEALRESEKRLHDILMSSADFIWEVDKNGKYTFAMGNTKKILGYEPKELIGKTPFDLMEKEEAERVGKIFKEVLSAKKPIVDLENWNITKGGRKVYLLTNGVPLIDENGNLTGYGGVDKDITDRKIKEEELGKRTEESERFSKLSVGRELKMVELKKRMKELEEKLKEKA